MTFAIEVKAVSAIATLGLVCLTTYRLIARKKNSRSATTVSLALSLKDEFRNKVRIAIVDDEVDIRFSKQTRDALLQRGFDVNYLEDVHDIKSIDAYQIVLCDIKGVGKNLAIGTAFHGGIVVSELRKRRPLVYIIIYSSLTYNPEFNHFFNLADEVADKGRLEEESLAVLLDGAIQTFRSPDQQWHRFMKWVLESGKDYKPHEIEKIHKAFLNMFTGGRGDTLESKIRNLGLYDGNSENLGIELVRSASDATEKLLELFK
jgi:hypothetical protein